MIVCDYKDDVCAIKTGVCEILEGVVAIEDAQIIYDYLYSKNNNDIMNYKVKLLIKIEGHILPS